MTIQITHPEIEELINNRLGTGAFQDAEDVILQALRSWSPASAVNGERAAAIERLRAFGKTYGLSLGGMTIRQLRDEARQ